MATRRCVHTGSRDLRRRGVGQRQRGRSGGRRRPSQPAPGASRPRSVAGQPRQSPEGRSPLLDAHVVQPLVPQHGPAVGHRASQRSKTHSLYSAVEMRRFAFAAGSLPPGVVLVMTG